MYSFPNFEPVHCSMSGSNCRWHSNTGLHSEQLLQPSWTILCLGPAPQKLTGVSSNKEIPPYHFLHHESLSFFNYFFLLSFFILSLGLQYHQVFISKLLMLHSNCTIMYTKGQSLVEAHDNIYQTHELAYRTGLANTCSHPRKFTTWRFACRGLIL